MSQNTTKLAVIAVAGAVLVAVGLYRNSQQHRPSQRPANRSRQITQEVTVPKKDATVEEDRAEKKPASELYKRSILEVSAKQQSEKELEVVGTGNKSNEKDNDAEKIGASTVEPENVSVKAGNNSGIEPQEPNVHDLNSCTHAQQHAASDVSEQNGNIVGSTIPPPLLSKNNSGVMVSQSTCERVGESATTQPPSILKNLASESVALQQLTNKVVKVSEPQSVSQQITKAGDDIQVSSQNHFVSNDDLVNNGVPGKKVKQHKRHVTGNGPSSESLLGASNASDKSGDTSNVIEEATNVSTPSKASNKKSRRNRRNGRLDHKKGVTDGSTHTSSEANGNVQKAAIKGKSQKHAMNGKTQKHAMNGKSQNGTAHVQSQNGTASGKSQERVTNSPSLKGSTANGKSRRATANGKSQNSSANGKSQSSSANSKSQSSPANGKSQSSSANSTSQSSPANGKSQSSSANSKSQSNPANDKPQKNATKVKNTKTKQAQGSSGTQNNTNVDLQHRDSTRVLSDNNTPNSGNVVGNGAILSKSVRGGRHGGKRNGRRKKKVNINASENPKSESKVLQSS